MDYCPGAAGTQAVGFVAKAPAYGYTLHMCDSGSIPLVRSKKLKALAVTWPARLLQPAEAPTSVEEGFPFLDAFYRSALWRPRGCPHPWPSATARHSETRCATLPSCVRTRSVVYCESAVRRGRAQRVRGRVNQLAPADRHRPSQPSGVMPWMDNPCKCHCG